MTELWLALGKGGTVEFEGKVYQTGQNTFEVIAGWEDWLASRALEPLLRLNAKKIDGEVKSYKAVGEMAAQGKFDFYGTVSEERMNTPSGAIQLFFLRIRQNHPDITKEIIARMIESNLADELKKQYQKEQAALDAILPNVEAPAVVSAGAPCLPESSKTPAGQSTLLAV